jgi:pimeloyl-ACP methyl ester carboxylesterase
MKKLKQIILQTQVLIKDQPEDLNSVLWQLICYPPKMPVRLLQEQLLNEATPFSLKVIDEYFANKELAFNGFKWGNGKHKVLITHGWGSKAADFSEIITALRQLKDIEIIAFDAPGNGRSEGELSNLLLFNLAIKAIISDYGKPDIVIGHSLGVMANIIALKETGLVPALLISLTPLVRLKENFEASMNVAGVPLQAQENFFKSFEKLFNKPASYYNLIEWYTFDGPLKHWLAYDKNDLTSPYKFLEEFLNVNPYIDSKNYSDAGHERILKSPEMINDLVNEVKTALSI